MEGSSSDFSNNWSHSNLGSANTGQLTTFSVRKLYNPKRRQRDISQLAFKQNLKKKARLLQFDRIVPELLSMGVDRCPSSTVNCRRRLPKFPSTYRMQAAINTRARSRNVARPHNHNRAAYVSAQHASPVDTCTPPPHPGANVDEEATWRVANTTFAWPRERPWRGPSFGWNDQLSIIIRIPCLSPSPGFLRFTTSVDQGIWFSESFDIKIPSILRHVPIESKSSFLSSMKIELMAGI